MSTLVDIVFPTDTNHHGTLFGGAALAHMDKVAFVAATRHGRATFVTASCDRIDFRAPARHGELVEASGRVIRVGRRSLSVEVTLVAEALLSGERRLCTRGVFNMVAVAEKGAEDLPPLPADSTADGPAELRMVEMVFPDRINHYGTLFGGEALAMMDKAAFIAATRLTRKVMVTAASRQVDFTRPIAAGDMVELVPRVVATGRRSVTVEVEFWGEQALTGERTRCAVAEFVLVAVEPRSGSPD